MVAIPSWLEAPDTAGAYLHGLQIGTGVAEARARNQQQQAQSQMESSIRMQQIEKQSELQKARLQTEAAYRDTQLELRNRQLGQVEQMNAMRTQQAAMKLADQQKFSQLIGGGMSVREALAQVPSMATPQAVIGAEKQASDLEGEKLDLRKQGAQLAADTLAQRQYEFEERQKRTSPKESMSIGELVEARTRTDDAELKKQLDDIISKRVTAEHTRMTGRDSLTPPPAPDSKKAPKFKEGQLIRDSESGKLYRVKNGRPVPLDGSDGANAR